MWNAELDESQDGIKIAERNINNLRYADDATLTAEIEEELNSLLMRVKEEREKAGLELNIQKLSWHPVPSLNGKYKRGKWKKWQIFFSWAPKSPWIVTATMKLKDTCSLEEKLWQT